MGVKVAVLVFAFATAAGAVTPEGSADARFKQANDLVRAGDYPKAIAAYQELAGADTESPALYWNWAQAAAARGGQGEALWALLRARELDPGDRAVAREIERLREAVNLDPAEIAPEPLAAAARYARRFRLGLVSLTLLVLSVLSHLMVRVGTARWPSALGGIAFGLGLLCAAVPVAGAFARPTAVIIRRGAALLDAASPTAEAVGSLREGEVVPVLAESGDYLRIEDSSGARGWSHASDVRRLDPFPIR